MTMSNYKKPCHKKWELVFFVYTQDYFIKTNDFDVANIG
jgi:hypothetical protein